MGRNPMGSNPVHRHGRRPIRFKCPNTMVDIVLFRKGDVKGTIGNIIDTIQRLYTSYKDNHRPCVEVSPRLRTYRYQSSGKRRTI
jgi:hypothetical protein